MSIATRIEFAFGANLTANPATWTWTDVSTYALGSVAITAGRSDEAGITQPAQCKFRLANTDARFSPRIPTSPYYPNVRRQTPVRVSLNPGTGYAQRFQGYVDVFAPTWPAGNSYVAEVTVTASGILRRLGQGNSPLKSPLYRALSTAAPFAYWPLEDGPQADRLAGIGGGSAVSLVHLLAVGAAEFGAVRPPTGASTMPSFIRGGTLVLQVGSAVSSAWTVELALFFGTGEPAPADYGTPNAMNVFKMFASNGDYWEFQLSPHNSFFPNGRVALFRSDYPEVFFDSLVDTAIGTFNPWDGLTHHVAVTASQSGSDIAWQLILDGQVYASATLAGRTLQPIDSVQINQNGFLASSSTYGLGHFAVFQSVISVTAHARAAAGWVGETAGDRIVRLCAEASIPATVSSTTGTAPMGPQSAATLVTLLRESELVDGGILSDGAGPGINYLALKDRYHLPVTLALDCVQRQVKLPFAPFEDDQRVRNDWTVSRTGGSFSHVADTVHIAANGLYDSSLTINTQYDSDLVNQAGWRVRLGTVDEMRVPSVTMQLIDHPELWAAWIAMAIGSRFTAANLPSQYPPGLLDMIEEGYAETWDAVSWAVIPNCSPYRPWQVLTFQGAGDQQGRFDSDASTLSAGVTSAAVSFSVATAATSPLWTTVSAHFPFDIEVNGDREKITVTNITGTSPQTFTVTRASGGTTALAKPINSTVRLWQAGVFAL